MTSATAIAHPNIALSKYWGKRAGGGNFPATPSLSVTLSDLETRTLVEFDDALAVDELTLNGTKQLGEPLARATELLDRVRAAAGRTARARVVSTNNFPTASGLASSASGFAAMALAAVRAAGLGWSSARISDLARRSSASAARSLFGGFVELAAGPERPTEDAILAAVPFAPADTLDLRVLIAVTTEAEKSVASRDGMTMTASASPFYFAWLSRAPGFHDALRKSILARDFLGVGDAAESSALAMHASAIAAGVVYWNGATIEVLHAVKRLRAAGVFAFATIDAGPHVKVLVLGDEDSVRVSEVLARVPGVLRVLPVRIGGPATVLEEDAS